MERTTSIVIACVCVFLILPTLIVASIAMYNVNNMEATEVNTSATRLLTATNVQVAINRLNEPATSDQDGLMTSFDKKRLSETTIGDDKAFALNVYENVYGACVTVLSTFSGNSVSTGSGFIYDAPSPPALSSTSVYIVTAAHVVVTSEQEYAGTITVVVSDNNTLNVQVPCVVVGVDGAADIAVLRTLTVAESPSYGYDFPESDVKKLSFDTGTALPGTQIVGIGNPQGNDISSVTSGVVRDGKYVPSKHSGSVESIYTDLAIIGGNSGGPVLNTNAQVIGLTNWIATSRVDINENESIQVPLTNFSGGTGSFIAKPLVDAIISTGSDVDKGFMGVAISSLVAGIKLHQLRDMYPSSTTVLASPPNGLYIQTVISGYPLANAGFQDGDVITSIDGTSIGSFDDQYSPTRVTFLKAPGTVVSVDGYRPSTNAYLSNVPVTLASFPPALDVPQTAAF